MDMCSLMNRPTIGEDKFNGHGSKALARPPLQQAWREGSGWMPRTGTQQFVLAVGFVAIVGIVGDIAVQDRDKS